MKNKIFDRQKLEEKEECFRAVFEEYKKRFMTFFEKAAIGMVILEANLPPSGKGALLEYNPAAQRFFGYSAEELRHKTVADLTHPDDVEKDFNLIMELLNNKRDSYSLEKRFIHKNGRIIWGKWSFTQIRDRNNHPKWGLATIEDITELRETTQRLLSSEHELKSRLEELEKFYEMAVGRELRMRELKKDLKIYKAKLSVCHREHMN